MGKIKFYINCPPGLESVLAAEYHPLGFTRVKTRHDEEGLGEKSGDDSGGMEFEGPLEQVYLANLHMRCAGRVILRIGEFIAITFAELRKKIAKMDWEQYLIPGQKVNVQVTCRKSRLYHSDGVAERVLGGINDHFSKSGLASIQSGDGQIIQVRLVNDNCTISMDSSGDLLHRRGYRLATAKAPLRENLAAGILISSGWDISTPLIDPFCGSGTIPIEAALLARNIPPGINRSFRFMDWPIFEQGIWLQQLQEAKDKIRMDCPPLFGFDRDAGAIKLAQENAARVGQKDTILFQHQSISQLEPQHDKGWIVTNPPYGVRINTHHDLRDLYARFGNLLISQFAGWHTSILCNSEQLIGNLGLNNPRATLHLTNGGIPVKLVHYLIGN